MGPHLQDLPTLVRQTLVLWQSSWELVENKGAGLALTWKVSPRGDSEGSKEGAAHACADVLGVRHGVWGPGASRGWRPHGGGGLMGGLAGALRGWRPQESWGGQAPWRTHPRHGATEGSTRRPGCSRAGPAPPPQRGGCRSLSALGLCCSAHVRASGRHVRAAGRAEAVVDGVMSCLPSKRKQSDPQRDPFPLNWPERPRQFEKRRADRADGVQRRVSVALTGHGHGCSCGTPVSRQKRGFLAVKFSHK